MSTHVQLAPEPRSAESDTDPELERLLRCFGQACYSATDAARMLGCSPRQLQRFVREAQLRKIQLGRRRDAFLAIDLAAFLAARLRDSEARPRRNL